MFGISKIPRRLPSMEIPQQQMRKQTGKCQQHSYPPFFVFRCHIHNISGDSQLTTLIILEKNLFFLLKSHLIRQIYVSSHVCGVTTVESWVQTAGVRPRALGESSSMCLWRITVNTDDTPQAKQHLTYFNVKKKSRRWNSISSSSLKVPYTFLQAVQRGDPRLEAINHAQIINLIMKNKQKKKEMGR